MTWRQDRKRDRAKERFYLRKKVYFWRKLLATPPLKSIDFALKLKPPTVQGPMDHKGQRP